MRRRRDSSAVKSSAIRTRAPRASSPTRSIAACPSRRRESMTLRPASIPSTFSATSFSRSLMSLTSSFLNVGLRSDEVDRSLPEQEARIDDLETGLDPLDVLGDQLLEVADVLDFQLLERGSPI